MSKKIVFIFVFTIFSAVLFAETKISLGEISFTCPENVDLIFDDSYNGYSSFFAQAKKREKNLLDVSVFSFDEFVKYEKDNWHSVDSTSFKSFKESCLKNKKLYDNGPAETCIQDVYEDKGLIIATSYDFQSLWYVTDIGYYSIAVLGENKIYLFRLYFNKITSHADDRIFTQMKEYVNLVYPGVKLGDMPGEQQEGWMFNNGMNAYNLHNDIKNKKTGVKEIDEFQKNFETVLKSIDSNQLVKVLDNIRIRKQARLDSESLVTVNKGEKIKIKKRAAFIADKIDDITDYWYEVTVLKGTADKDGNIIQNDINGFCFGGYLDK